MYVFSFFSFPLLSPGRLTLREGRPATRLHTLAREGGGHTTVVLLRAFSQANPNLGPLGSVRLSESGQLGTALAGQEKGSTPSP